MCFLMEKIMIPCSNQKYVGYDNFYSSEKHSKLENNSMKVSCSLTIGNNQDHPEAKIEFVGDPTKGSQFVDLVVNDVRYEIKPNEIILAMKALNYVKVG